MRRTREGALCRPESRKLEAGGEGSVKTEAREPLAWCLFGFGSEGGGMRKQCLVGVSSCVGQGCWRKMRERTRTLSSVFDLLSLKSLLGAYLEMLLWSLVVGALGLEQDGGKEGRTGRREDRRRILGEVEQAGGCGKDVSYCLLLQGDKSSRGKGFSSL